MEEKEVFTLRRAQSEDCCFLYELRNEDAVRRSSFHTEWIPYDQHQRWFIEKLGQKDTQIYILMKGDKAIGQARVDWSARSAEISYALIKEVRGHGYAKWMLAGLEELLIGGKAGQELVAEVKRENMASRHIFQSLHYEERETKFGYEYKKRIG